MINSELERKLSNIKLKSKEGFSQSEISLAACDDLLIQNPDVYEIYELRRDISYRLKRYDNKIKGTSIYLTYISISIKVSNHDPIPRCSSCS